MQYAYVNGIPQEASPGLKGFCPGCGHQLLPKCGVRRLRIWHWSHFGERDCDSFKEPETQWHRDWKGLFPLKWREVYQTAASGEKHRADVKTTRGWIFEFQHSPIQLKERQDREAFYSKLIWIVDATHLKRAKKQFSRLLNESTWLSESPALKKILYPHECEMLRNWLGCRAPVIFDFGEGTPVVDSALWCLLPYSPDGGTYMAKFNRPKFLNYHLVDESQAIPDFTVYLKKYRERISDYITQREMEKRRLAVLQAWYSSPDRSESFREEQARFELIHRRRRF